MTQGVGGISQVMNSIDLGATGSLQLQFAKLQLALSEMAKSGAMNYIDQIQKSQDEQKQVAAMLQQARQLQTDADNKNKTEMPPELKAYMDANGLAYDQSSVKDINDKIAKNQEKINQNNAALEEIKGMPIGGLVNISASPSSMLQNQNAALAMQNIKLKADAEKISFTKDEWNVAIQSLQAHLDTLGTNTQQLMVFVQDFMGQYNSYLQGANSAIQQSNQTLAELARVR